MDNCTIHHTSEIDELLKETGMLIHWLPPYSPDMNPIEEAFSKAKATMRAMQCEMDVLDDTESIVYSTWIRDHGIYNI